MRVKTIRVDTRPSILFVLNNVLHFYGVLHQKILKWLELNFKQWKIIRTYNKNPIKHKHISSFLQCFCLWLQLYCHSIIWYMMLSFWLISKWYKVVALISALLDGYLSVCTLLLLDLSKPEICICESFTITMFVIFPYIYVCQFLLYLF